MSLFLSCIFYFVAKIWKTCYRKKWKTEPLKPFYRLKKPVLNSCWLDHWKWLMPDLMHMVHEFSSNRQGLNRFSWWLTQTQQKNCDLSKVSKEDQIGWILTCPELVKYISTLNCSKLAKWLVWKSLYIQSQRC